MVSCLGWSRPFIIECDEYAFPYEISIEEIDQAMDPVLAGLGGQLLGEGEDASSIPKEQPAAAQMPKLKEEYVALSEQAGHVLRDIANPDNWMESIDERFTRLGISNRNTRSKIISELKEPPRPNVPSFIEECRVIAGRGAPKTITIPTVAAYEHYLGGDPRKFHIPGKGGLEHKYYQHLAAGFYTKVYGKADVERDIKTDSGRKGVDVVARDKEGGLITIEIACSPGHEVNNAIAALQDGKSTKHIIVCRDAGIEQNVNQHISKFAALKDLKKKGVLEITTVSEIIKQHEGVEG